MSKSIDVDIFGDTTKEGDEWFFLELTDINGDVIKVKPQAVGVISDND